MRRWEIKWYNQSLWRSWNEVVTLKYISRDIAFVCSKAEWERALATVTVVVLLCAREKMESGTRWKLDWKDKTINFFSQEHHQHCPFVIKAGIVSFGPSPCDTHIPSVFTRVAGFRLFQFLKTTTFDQALVALPDSKFLIILWLSCLQGLDRENGGTKWGMGITL